MAVLESVVEYLLAKAPSEVLELNMATGFPLYVVPDGDIDLGEVKYNWTTTGLAVLNVNPASGPGEGLNHAALARLLALVEVARGLPLRIETRDAFLCGVSESVAETVAMLRARKAYLSHSGDPKLYVPKQTHTHVDGLRQSLSFQSSDRVQHPAQRLAAALVAARFVGSVSLRKVVEARWPRIARRASGLQHVHPQAAANELFRFSSNLHEAPEVSWVTGSRRNVPAKRAHAKAIGVVADAVLATCEVNSKGSRFTLDGLLALTMSARAKPFVNFDHDRSIPPGMVLLDVQLHRHADGASVKATVGAFTSAGIQRLEAGGGFSPAVDLG